MMNYHAQNLSIADFMNVYKDKGKPDMITHRGYTLLHVVTSFTTNRDHLEKVRFVVDKAISEDLDLSA